MNTAAKIKYSRDASSGRFRAKLQMAMMLSVLFITALVLFFEQRNMQRSYEKDSRDEFQSRIGFNLGQREARQSSVSELCRLLAKSVRIRAALEEDSVEDLYLNAKIESRNILSEENGKGTSHPTTVLRAKFIRFFDENGSLLIPPGEKPGALEKQITAAGLDPASQQTGYIEIKDTTGQPALDEVVTTPIIDEEDKLLGGFVLGFTPLDVAAKTMGPEIKNGMWVDGRLYMPALDASARALLAWKLEKVLHSRDQTAASSELDIGGEPYLLFYKLLNPGSRFAPSYEISLYSLAASLAEQKSLRWKIISVGIVALLAGLAGTRYFSGKLAAPVEQLAEDSAQNLALREEAEAAREITEQKYRSIYENAVEGIFLLSRHGRYLNVNPSLARIYGYGSPEQLCAELTDPARQLYADPADCAEFLKRATSDTAVSGFETEVFRKDGRKIWVSQNTFAVRDASGSILHFEGTLEDVTERKQSADALRALNIELEKTLVELRATQQQIIQQERLRALGQMAGGVAHDFNNALTPIIGFSELLSSVPNALDDRATAIEYLGVINMAAKDAANIVARLREFSRSKESHEVFTSVDLTRLAEQVVALTQPKWKDQALARGAEIRMAAELAVVPPIAGDESALREVLTNLIFNAADAMPEGGVITLRTRNSEGHIFLEVEDTGTGMSAEVKARCLEPFFSTKGERGTGLGLAMTFGIIKRHKGTIDIDTEIGRGTKFILGFPPDETPMDGTVHDNQPEPMRSLRILIVDDEIQVRRVLAAMLQADAHGVVSAGSGTEGLEHFVGEKFDLVITDWAMPGMNGGQFAEAIKQLSPVTPVVLLSGFVSVDGNGKTPAVDLVMAKPILLPTLRETIRKAMTPA